MTGGFGGDLGVSGGGGGASGVACGGFDDALDALEDGLRTPEAAAREDCGFAGGSVGEWSVELRRSDGSCSTATEAGRDEESCGEDGGAQG